MKEKILANFPTQKFEHSTCKNLHVVDYTKQTASKKGVGWHSSKPPDINSFHIQNALEMGICLGIFDDHLFKKEEEKDASHCECVLFPEEYDEQNSWILFLELKYGKFVRGHLSKAQKQLFATLNYFREKNIIASKKLVYLIVSLPNRNKIPFESFLLTPSELKAYRKQYSVIFRGTNFVEIKNSKKLKV